MNQITDKMDVRGVASLTDEELVALIVEDEAKALAFIRQMSAKFTDDTDYVEREIAQALDHTLIFTLTPEHITGKLVNEA